MPNNDVENEAIDGRSDEAEAFAWVGRQFRFERILAALECEDAVRRSGDPG
jgi:hypothetical protein